MTEIVEPEAGQVWEHRHDCRLCRGVRHAYLVIRVKGPLVCVRDYHVRDQMPVGTVYAHDRRAYGSLSKGGLRLAGHVVAGRFQPLAEPDDRAIDHKRVAFRSLPTRIVPSDIHA